MPAIYSSPFTGFMKMSVRVYSEIGLHITWHTKDSLPLITAAMRPELYAYLKKQDRRNQRGIFSRYWRYRNSCSLGSLCRTVSASRRMDRQTKRREFICNGQNAAMAARLWDRFVWDKRPRMGRKVYP